MKHGIYEDPVKHKFALVKMPPNFVEGDEHSRTRRHSPVNAFSRTDSEVIMPGTIVPYERFLQIRQRRKIVVAELTQPGSMPKGDVRDGEPPTIDCDAAIQTRCGTRTQAAVALRQKRLGPTADEARR